MPVWASHPVTSLRPGGLLARLSVGTGLAQPGLPALLPPALQGQRSAAWPFKVAALAPPCVSAPLPGFSGPPSHFSQAPEPKLVAIRHGQRSTVLSRELEGQAVEGESPPLPAGQRETASVTSVTSTTHLGFSSALAGRGALGGVGDARHPVSWRRAQTTRLGSHGASFQAAPAIAPFCENVPRGVTEGPRKPGLEALGVPRDAAHCADRQELQAQGRAPAPVPGRSHR